MEMQKPENSAKKELKDKPKFLLNGKILRLLISEVSIFTAWNKSEFVNEHFYNTGHICIYLRHENTI